MGKVLEPLSSGASSLIGTAGDIYSNERNIKLQRETNAQQYKMFQEGNEFTAGENEKARQFNSQEAEIARRFNSAQAYQQFLRQEQLNASERKFNSIEAEKARQFEESMFQKYESPEAMAAALQKAGINPAGVLGANVGGIGTVGAASSGAGSAAGASSPAASSGAGGSLGVPSLMSPRIVNPMQNLIDGFVSMQNSISQSGLNKSVKTLNDIKSITQLDRDLADLDKAISEAEKNGEDTKMMKLQRDILDKSKASVVADNQMQLELHKMQFKQASVDYCMSMFEQQMQADRYTLFKDLTNAQIDSMMKQASSAWLQACSAKFNSETNRFQLNFDIGKWKEVWKDFYNEQKKTFSKSLEVSDSQIGLNEAKETNIDADTRNLRQDTRNKKQDYGWNQWRWFRYAVDTGVDIWKSLTSSAGIFRAVFK